MKITVPNKMTNPNPFDNDEFDMQSTGASSLSVTTDEGSNDVSVSSLQPSSSLKNTSCTSSPKSVATSSSSSQPKQQQQQQTFRFQGLYKLLGKNNNKSSATDASKTLLSGDDTAAAATVADHEKTVDHVLSGMESPEQARDLLRGIVADLLRENDSLKALLQEKEQALQATQEECNIVKEEYTDRLISIKKTVERSIGGASCGFEIIPNTKNGTEAAAPAAASKLPVISPEQATNMVIQSLSNKVEQLSVEKETLEQELTQTIERMEDLESINESRLYKIEALEAQFRSINKMHLNTAQPNIKASCRRQGTDSPAFEVTLPSRAITPRSTTSSSSTNGNSSSSPTQQQHQPTAAKVVVTPTVGPTTDTGMSPVKIKTKKPTTPQPPTTTKSKKMSRSTPRQAFISNDFDSFIEVGPGMGEI